MAKRADDDSGRREGVLVERDIVVERQLEAGEEGVHRVERVMEMRKKKGTMECLVLWDGCRRETATWVKEEEMTAAALRTFTHPNPSTRIVLDAVSNLTTAMIKSMKLGLIRGYKFNVIFRRDVFNFLFQSRGVAHPSWPGKLYDRSEFSNSYFRDNDFVYTNQHGERVFVDFPVYMYSFVEYVKLGSDTCDCLEYVSVALLKKRY